MIKVFSDFLNIYYSGEFEEVYNYTLNSNHIDYLSVELPDGEIIDAAIFLKDYDKLQKFYTS
jgi:hypothetical protein